jgi:hypothetical protein
VGDAPWQRALAATLDRRRPPGRVPACWAEPRRLRPDAEALRAAGLERVGAYRFPTAHRWTVESLIGFVYSTSFLSRAALGGTAPALQRDLADALHGHALVQTLDFADELAR